MQNILKWSGWRWAIGLALFAFLSALCIFVAKALPDEVFAFIDRIAAAS